MRLKILSLGLMIVAAVAVIIGQQQSLGRLRRDIAGLREHRSETIPDQQKIIPTPQSKAVLSTEETANAQRFAWETLEADDYGTYIANLRALGLPEQIIRDIIIADLDRTYATRVAQLTLAQKQQQSYWRVPNFNATVRYERELSKIEQEKRVAVRELLGVDLDEEMSLRKTGAKDHESEFDYLSDERRRQVVECQRKYDSLGRDLAVKKNTGLLSDDEYNAQIRQLYQTRDADVMSLLGPDEAAEYQMRRSDLAYRLPRQLEALEPSEEEYRKIFSIESQFFAQHPIGEQVDPGLEKQHQDALRAALGEQRYAEYQKAISFDYFNLYKIAEEFSLPRAVVDTVYQIQPQAEAEAAVIRNDPSLSPEAKAAALRALREETEMEMAKQLGDVGYNRYLSRAHFWLSRISP
jgi:hypothetical protein